MHFRTIYVRAIIWKNITLLWVTSNNIFDSFNKFYNKFIKLLVSRLTRFYRVKKGVGSNSIDKTPKNIYFLLIWNFKLKFILKQKYYFSTVQAIFLEVPSWNNKVFRKVSASYCYHLCYNSMFSKNQLIN